MRDQFTGSSSRATVAGHVRRAATAVPAAPRRSARSREPMTRRNARANASGVGSLTSPETPSCTSSVGPPLSVQVMTALAGGEGFDGHEPIVLVEGREDHGAAASQVLDQRGLVQAARQATRSASKAALLHQARHLVERLALSCQHGADAARPPVAPVPRQSGPSASAARSVTRRTDTARSHPRGTHAGARAGAIPPTGCRRTSRGGAEPSPRSRRASRRWCASR